MLPTQDPAPARGDAPAAAGELVVQNGRQAGARRPLGAPLTFLGRAGGCDVRLTVDGISPLHCVIAHGPSGLVLRDLDSALGTFVNGVRVATSPLHDGDLLAVGPFQFRVRLGPPPDDIEKERRAARAAADVAEKEAMRARLEEAAAEKDALRVQAAAVAAQQAALTEAEARLAERRGALEQQERQLAAHLEEKRRRLLQIAEHAQAARASLQKERKDHDQHIEKVTSDLGQAQRDLLEAQKKAQAERKRVLQLSRRLRQRYHRHWLAERRATQQRAAALTAERRRLEQEGERLQQEKAALVQLRLRYNGEAELAKRQLQADRDALRAEQQQWKDQRAREQAAVAERERGVAHRDAALADAERLLEDERYRWEKGLGYLKRETEGLETRIRNQRRKVVEQQQEIGRLEARIRGLQHQAESAQAALPPPPVVTFVPPAVVTVVPPPAALPESPPVAAPEAPPAPAAEFPSPEEPPSPAAAPEAPPAPTAGAQAEAPAAEPTAASESPAPAAEPAPAQAEAPPAPPVSVEPPRQLVPLQPALEQEAQRLVEAAKILADKEAELEYAERALRRRAAMLEKLTEEVADQRLLLMETWWRLAEVHCSWHDEREATARELEALAAQLPEREQALAARQRALEATEADLCRRHQEAVHLRQHLEGWKSRLRVRESGWESERDRALADLRAREQLAERHLDSLIDLRQRWAKRRRQELDVVRAERAACERLRQECAGLRQELWRRGTAMEEERRLLAQKTLALEQYRQQYLVRAADAAAAERRVERLRRRWVAQNANLIRATVAERQALQQEVARLEDRHTALHKQMESLTVREASLAQRQTAWEEEQALAETQQGKLRQELQSMQAQRDRYALHLIELQDEVERIARLLLDEPQSPLQHSPHAA